MAAGRTAFVQAQNDRYKDAQALLKAKRWGGAIYLGGYAVECLLKARILKRKASGDLPREYWHHDLLRLMDVSGVAWEIKLPKNSALQDQMLLITGTWDVTMRYGSTQFTNRHEAQSFLEAVRKVRRWLQDSLRNP
jgi:HEPN domain-containing protein